LFICNAGRKRKKKKSRRKTVMYLNIVLCSMNRPFFKKVCGNKKIYQRERRESKKERKEDNGHKKTTMTA